MRSYDAGSLDTAIQRRKWLMSERAGYDVGTPIAVDALLTDIHCGTAHSQLHPSNDQLHRDNLIGGYLFAPIREPLETPEVSAFSLSPQGGFRHREFDRLFGELERFGARQKGLPLESVAINKPLIEQYAQVYVLSDTLRNKILSEYDLL